MKLAKYIIVGLAALTLVSCEKDDPTFADYVPPKTNSGGDDNTGTDEPEVPAGAVLAEVTINKNQAYHTIKGFGASDCWAPQFVGQNWTSCRDELATLLFDQSASGATTRGIGLSMWRMNLGAGTLEAGEDSGIENYGHRAECYLTDNDYDWTKCEGQRFWMDKAREMGVESLIFFSNSPLVKWTYNRQGRSDRGLNSANIRQQYMPLFADYMAEVAAHFKNAGYNITHISPFNEPQYAWDGTDQEGSGWSTAEQAAMVRFLDTALNEKGVDVDILPGEVVDWTRMYENNEILRNYFGGGDNDISNLAHVKNNLVCGHSYWTDKTWANLKDVRTKVANAAAQYNAEVWQSEWSMLANEGDEYDLGIWPGFTNASEMDHSMWLSRVIHNDLVYANVSSWSYWTSMDQTLAEHKNRFVLIRLIPDGSDYTDGDGSYEATTNLWVLGNYSLCIRPGYVRVDTKVDNESAQFFGSSYLSPDNTRLVSVYTNDTENPFYLSNEFEGRDEVMAIKTYTTTETDKLTPANVRVNDYVVIPAKSVVTVVYDL